MRSRLVIPAALLVTAAYVGTRRGARPIAPLRVVPPPPVDPARRAQAEAEAADARALAAAEAAPALEEPSEPEPEPEPEPGPALARAELRIAADGRFSLGGWALQAGHMALCGVTFDARADTPPSPAAISLEVEASSNVADGGLVVLGDAGFAPDAEGFTLMLAAAGPGGFAASGRYALLG